MKDTPLFLLENGKIVLIRTVTQYHVGRVTALTSVEGVGFVVLEDASWAADTGRYADCLKNGKLDECEFAGAMMVGLGSIVDIAEFHGALPQLTK